MALISVNLPYNSPFLKFSSNLPRQGEAVIAIGNPRGLSGTVSNGIVSAIRETNNNLLIQFTAPISPGSSGGALVNLNGEVVGMTSWLFDADKSQNLNFAVASTVLMKFFDTAKNKTPRNLPKPKRQEQNINGIQGTKFVRKDDMYTMYLDIENIDYDKHTGIVRFLTYWIPEEKAKIQMRSDPNFNIPRGEDLGPCVLLYEFNVRDNTYLHKRTINFLTNGSIARDYIRPSNECIWRTPKKGSRIETLVREVKRQLNLK